VTKAPRLVDAQEDVSRLFYRAGRVESDPCEVQEQDAADGFVRDDHRVDAALEERRL
jgi:hypothetical protein